MEMANGSGQRGAASLLTPQDNDSLPQQPCPEMGWVTPADGERLSTCSPANNRDGTGRKIGWILQDSDAVE